jgi:predicted ATPase
VLSIAAVISQVFMAPGLETEQTSDTSIDADLLLALLNEGVAARFLVPTVCEMGQYSFTHALIRETLYTDLAIKSRNQDRSSEAKV